MYCTVINTPLGKVTVACRRDGSALTGLWLAGQRFFGPGYPEPLEREDALPLLLQTKEWLERYFAGECPAIAELPLAPVGTPFRVRVWQELCRIPYGAVTSYGEIARTIARERGIPKMSAQAVGGAVGHNPISIIIPCHRVLGAHGELTGYGGGLWRKIRLLKLEGAVFRKSDVPRMGR